MSFIQTDSKSIWKNNSIPLCLFMVLCAIRWSWNMWDRLNMKQLNQIRQHHMFALAIRIWHAFSISAIINPLLDTGLPVSCNFCHIWIVCLHAVLNDRPGCASAILFSLFCWDYQGLATIPEPPLSISDLLFWWQSGTFLLLFCILTHVTSHDCPIHCICPLNITIIFINDLFNFLWSNMYFALLSIVEITRLRIIKKEIVPII